MLIALAADLAVGWILAFLVLHVTTIAIHTLAFGAVLSLLVHFIHVRHYLNTKGDHKPMVTSSVRPARA